jgi:hypothetical protein
MTRDNIFAHIDFTTPEMADKVDKGRKRLQLYARLSLAAVAVLTIGGVWLFATVGFSWKVALALLVTDAIAFGLMVFFIIAVNKWDEDLAERLDELLAEREL